MPLKARMRIGFSELNMQDTRMATMRVELRIDDPNRYIHMPDFNVEPVHPRSRGLELERNQRSVIIGSDMKGYLAFNLVVGPVLAAEFKAFHKVTPDDPFTERERELTDAEVHGIQFALTSINLSRLPLRNRFGA